MAKNNPIDEASAVLFSEFQRFLPLDAAPSKKRRRSPQDLTKATEKGLASFYQTAKEERLRRRLGVISRARVALGLQKRLLAAGYPPPLVKQVVFSLIVSAFVGGAKS